MEWVTNHIRESNSNATLKKECFKALLRITKMSIFILAYYVN